MEEILASIRRIIEDNETVQKEAASEPANLPADSSSEIASFRAELRPTTDFPKISEESQNAVAKEPDTDSRPMAWADRQQTSTQENDVPAAEQHLEEVEPAEPSEETRELTRASFEVFESTNSAPRSIADQKQASEVSVSAEAKPNAVPSLRPNILSEGIGRQVASSFRELNEVLEANRRQSLDQMAEEMLRPMLQEWLDNSLPQLVERLVREEIERIARGA